MVLALVNPPSRLTYEAYKAAKALGGVLGGLLAAAEAALAGSLALTTAAAIGAGIGGFAIGQSILNSLELPQTLPPPGEFYEFKTPGQFAEVQYNTFINGVQQNFEIWGSIGETPSRGMFNRKEDGVWTFFFLDKNNDRRVLFTTSSTVDSAEVEILNFRLTGTNTPLAPTSKLPSYAPNSPGLPKPVPANLPIPGFDPFPISPRVVPNPGNDEPSENEERQPGIVVQIPETGTQIRYEPGGVTITNYNAPNKAPFRVPGADFPPGSKAATQPCCPAEEPSPPDERITEIICRVKTLQDDILDDGFDFMSGQTATGQSGFFESAESDFANVKIQVLTRPANLRIQPSTSPASNVWYVGWFSWVVNGDPGERLPLHFQSSRFLPPPGVSGFMFQLNAGCTGFGQYRIRTKRDYIDVC